MRVLLVKTSSMGDVVHALPALTDAQQQFPRLQVDWVVEEGFAEIPAWHPAVDKVIPVSIRRWRKHWLKSWYSGEIKAFGQEVARQRYDVVIDAQGLLKSAWIARKARGLKCGLDRMSAKEPLSSWFYSKSINVPKQQHAVERIRQLFAQALGYQVPTTIGQFGLKRENFLPEVVNHTPYVVFLHGTTRADKHWPDTYWQTLCGMLTHEGLEVRLPWANEIEHQRAKTIARISPNAKVLPKMDLTGVAVELAGARAVVAVDTGLGHLSAALNVPTVSLYGPTSPDLIGAYGENQCHLCASDFAEVSDNGLGHEIEPAIFASLNPKQVASSVLELL